MEEEVLSVLCILLLSIDYLSDLNILNKNYMS